MNDTLRAALVLVMQGLPVFPVHTDKKPATPHGFKDAAKDASAACDLWHKYPAPLIGTPTGILFDVLDLDPRHGSNVWYETVRDQLPITRVHSTRSGGKHLFFKSHAGLKNSVGKIAPGVDIRAKGGYIIWWPAAGCTTFEDGKLAEWPDWLVKQLILARSEQSYDFEQSQAHTKAGNAYARAALNRASQNVMQAFEGTRNNTLNAETWCLMRFTKTGDLTVQEICNRMVRAGVASGLSTKEIANTLASVLRSWGIQ